MRFSTFVMRVFAAVAVVLASPLPPTSQTPVVAGSVLTKTGVTYQMRHFNEIKTFDSKVDNGEYPYPVTYRIKAGYSCIFYLEATRGVGSPIGEFEGPTAGSFVEKIECYKCWFHGSTAAQTVAAGTPDASPRADMAIPCGFVRTATGGTFSLNETGRNPKHPQDFAVNGGYYTPVSFHVADNCNCRFYDTSGGRGPELISEKQGVAEGDFNGKAATRYVCWIRA